MLAGQKNGNAAKDIAHLAFGKKYDAAIHHDVGIGTIHYKKVRVHWNGYAAIRPWIILPVRSEVDTTPADNLHGPEELCGMKTGPEDQYIGFYGLPTLRFDAVLSHSFYRVCNDVDVVPFKRENQAPLSISKRLAAGG